jgi:hypothetical protein
MHPNETFLRNADTATLMLEALERGPQYVAALREQLIRLDIPVPA